MKVLHIVENLNRGAVENWLVRMLEHARSRSEINVNWSFYCTLGQEGALDEKVRALGASVIYSPVPLAKKTHFIQALRSTLRKGQYDVLHCHHDLLSAVYLVAAAYIPIRRRIVHIHNAAEVVPTPHQFKQRLYRAPMRQLCLSMADRIVGNSNHTLDTFLAGRTRRPIRDTVHWLGIDPAPFQKAKGDRQAFRRKLGMSENSKLLLFVGRMVPEKNPLFAVDVLSEMNRIDPTVAGVFVGSGSLDDVVCRRAVDLGISRNFYHLGWRHDIPDIMCCCDLIILPSRERPMEGFGLAVIEGQLAGLRMLISRGVPNDALLPTAVFSRLALSAGADEWAKAAIELLHHSVPSRIDALTAFKHSPMDMDRALEELFQLYI